MKGDRNRCANDDEKLRRKDEDEIVTVCKMTTKRIRLEIGFWLEMM